MLLSEGECMSWQQEVAVSRKPRVQGVPVEQLVQLADLRFADL